MRLGELFAGYGGLGMAVEEVLGATTAWFSEWDPAPSKILAHHWPNVPNYGDVTKIDWENIEPVDIISGGSPCQDLSLAGKRRGMTDGTRSNLWESMREGIATIKPKYVVWENVRGALSAEAISTSDMEHREGFLGERGGHLRALGRVLGDLADLGYDAEWRGLRAADVGAPHGRLRVFVLAVAKDANLTARSERWISTPGQAQSGRTWADAGRRGGTPTADSTVPDAMRSGSGGRAAEPEQAGGNDAPLGSSAGAAAAHAGLHRCNWSEELHGKPEAYGQESEHRGHPFGRGVEDDGTSVEWGLYGPAIRRWETLRGTAPSPVELTPKGNYRLSSRFAEWMMGLPAGWVTDPEIGLSRNDQLKACGNGVVPQQAVAALTDMLQAFQAKDIAA